ncbi:MAG: acyltransferase [Endomicrobia bacterium]|nr:acyltransferase [Endomicrobiia bacterium]
MLVKIESINGIRAYLFFAISSFHYFLIVNPNSFFVFKNGFYAVDSFFFLSGFLITLSILEKDNHLSLWDNYLLFIKSRFLRLYPAFLFLIWIELIFIIFFENNSQKLFLDEIKTAIPSFYNWWLILRDIPYFERSLERLLNLHFWSLSIEWQFYLAWGFFLFFILKYIRKNQFTVILSVTVSLFIISLIMNLYSLVENKNFQFSYYSTLTRLSPFMLGVSSSAIYKKYGNSIKKSLIFDFSGALSLIGLSLIFSDSYIFQNILFPINSIIVSGFSILLVISAIKGKLMNNLLSGNIFNWIGKISYSGYLWNYPVIYFFSTTTSNKYLNGYIEFFLIFIINISIAAFSYYLFEQPYFYNRDNLKKETKIYIYKGLVNLTYGLFSFVVLLQLFHYKIEIEEYMNINSILRKEIATNKKNLDYLKKISNTPILKKADVLLIGDSFVEGASFYLKKEIPNILIDAKVSRQFSEIKEVIQKYDVNNFNAVVIALGTNGYVFQRDIDWLLNYMKNKNKIFFINTHVPKIWKNQVNQTLRYLSNNNSNVKIIDWESYSKEKRDIFIDDNVHLNSKGAEIFAKFLAMELLKDLDKTVLVNQTKH